ncbi:uncharacterized protein LOC132758391 [Ruditapes philippinarum]|uniref:uncharacterized protein LOC132758391 n=1 Tax=Ruditapes philippinarum TaxID=129788 RepID=UPI00295A6BF9|nr:uncharacterized protein LOC132758391 [Ruditapes philippinarum]
MKRIYWRIRRLQHTMMTEICPIMFIDGTFYVNLPNKVVSGSEVSGSEVSVSGSEVSGCNLFQALTGSSALGIAGSEMMKLYSQEMDKKNAKKPLDTYKSDQDLSDEKVSTELMNKTAFQSNVIHRPACNFGATSLFTSIKNLIIVLMCFAMVNPAAGGHVMDKGKVVDKDGAVYLKFPLLESWCQNPEQSTDTCPNQKCVALKVKHCQYKFPAGEKVQCLESEVGIVSFCIPEDVSCEGMTDT